jgi:hypothetical protein
MSDSPAKLDVKLDINQLITQIAQAWQALETSKVTNESLVRGGKVIGVQEGIHWDAMTGWDDEEFFVVGSWRFSTRGSRNLPFYDSTLFDIMCSYQKGGGIDGHGKFLQNVSFYLKITQQGDWGTGGMVEGWFDDPANRGTTHDPVAELTAHLRLRHGNDGLVAVTLNGATGHHVKML